MHLCTKAKDLFKAPSAFANSLFIWVLQSFLCLCNASHIGTSQSPICLYRTPRNFTKSPSIYGFVNVLQYRVLCNTTNICRKKAKMCIYV